MMRIQWATGGDIKEFMRRMELDIEIKNTFWEQKISNNLQTLLRNKTFCDLKFRTSDNQFVYSHLCVVTAFIPFLKVEFLREGNNSSSVKEVYLSNVSEEVMQKIVAFCYGSVLSVSAEQVGPLLVATDLLQMTDLHDLLAEEQRKVMLKGSTLVKEEPSKMNDEVSDSDTVSVEDKNLEVSFVINDGDELNDRVEEGDKEECDDQVEESEEVSVEHTAPTRKGTRKRKRKVFSYTTKKVSLKKQKTAKVENEKKKVSTRTVSRGKKVKLHCLRTEELEVKGEDSCDKTGQSSADLTVSEKNLPQPLSYDMFVKEISKEKFICKVCKKVWPSKEKTLAHVPSHSEENLRRNRNIRLTVNCVTCSKWFATKSHLRAHIKDVHLNPCKRKVFNNMFVHLSPFQCPVCEKKFKWASDLKQHVLHHGERQLSRVPGLELKYACDLCRLAFITKVSCKSHKDMYHVEESRYDADKDLRGKNVYDILYQCDKCKVECERLEQIEEHVKECDLQTSDSGSTHDKSVIEDGDNDQPSDINGVGKSVGALSHKPFHGGSLSEMQKVIKILKHSDTSDSDWSSMYSILVSCLVCRAKFTSVSEVRDHKKKHHPSEKPVKKKPPKQAIHMCDLCGVIYKNNASLLIHMHVVHNIQFQMKRKKQECKKPDAESLKWNCLYCSQRFRQRCGLRVHVVTHHTIEQLKQDYRFAERDKANYEYQCHLCKNKMKLYKSLQTHLRRFHGVRISRDSGSEYYDFDLAQKKNPSKETKQDSVPVQENVILNQEQIHFEASAGPKGDLDMTDISINPTTTYQQPIPNMQDVGSNLVQPYQTQDYVLLNTGLQLTFSGYPPVQ